MKKLKWLLFIGIAFYCASGVVFSASPAVLKPGDVLTITVKGEPELSGDRLVSQDGSINLPLIGSVGVSGMKANDAAQIIKQQFEDGFLKNPIVTVTTKSGSTNKQEISKPVFQMSESDLTYAVVDNEPLSQISNGSSQEQVVNDNSEEQILIELKDTANDKGIPNAVLSIGNKVYQTNRLGQILIKRDNSNAVIIADGYKTLSGSLSKLIKTGRTGSPSYIKLEKTRINEVVVVTVVDSKSHKPIRNAEIQLDGSKILTNSRGEFKISGIKKEYGEVTVKKRGYAVLKKVLDYKGPSIISLELNKQ